MYYIRSLHWMRGRTVLLLRITATNIGPNRGRLGDFWNVGIASIGVWRCKSWLERIIKRVTLLTVSVGEICVGWRVDVAFSLRQRRLPLPGWVNIVLRSVRNASQADGRISFYNVRPASEGRKEGLQFHSPLWLVLCSYLPEGM